MNPTIKIYILWCVIGIAKGNLEQTQIKPGYKVEYYIRDDHTGNFKTQEERRHGDYISGSYSVGEPNDDLRVVTYNADHKNGFNANMQIQPGGSPINSNIRDKEKHLEEIMKIVPKYQMKTGFPQLAIKIIPPKLSPTTTEIYGLQEENHKKDGKIGMEGDKVGTQRRFPADTNNNDSTIVLPLLQAEVSINNQSENANRTETIIFTSAGKSDECDDLCRTKNEDGEQEGRAHIKPHEDRVQLEMEQVIRAEMQEPTGVNLGVPYQHYKNIEQDGNKKYFMKPLNIDYKPLVNEEDIMKEGDGSTKQTLSINGATTFTRTGSHTPYLPESNVYMMPYNINGEERPWSRVPPTSRYPDMSRAVFAHTLSLQTPKPVAQSRALYTTGLAFFLLPRP